MIFLGDIAYPGKLSMTSETIHDCLEGKPIIANLEGPLVEEAEEFKKKRVLFNSIEFFDKISPLNIRLLNLANNHIMDLGLKRLLHTQEELSERNIPHVGAGRSISEAAESREIILNDKSFVFLSFGWEVIQCQIATREKPGINPIEKNYILRSIAEAKKKYPHSHLIVLFHWNYELELYPQPQERELARSCVHEGADVIVGCHSHLVQGIEIYQGAPIVYGLGNWFIPHNVFFNGKLQFPSETKLQLAFEWSPGMEPICHWFDYNPDDHQITFKESENLLKSGKVAELTPFRNLSQQEYVKWFKENRKQKKLLPIYKSADHRLCNYFKDKWVMLRGKLIDIMLKLGMKRVRTNLK